MSAARPTDRDAHGDAAQLERDIAFTRAQIDALVSALERKLSPNEAIDRTMAFARRHGGEFAGTLGRAVKANPMAAVLTSIGLAWLIGGRHAQPPANASTAEGASAVAGDGYARGAVDTARDGAQALRSGVDRLFGEQPLAAGALGLAVGALLAAITPLGERDSAPPRRPEPRRERALH